MTYEQSYRNTTPLGASDRIFHGDSTFITQRCGSASDLKLLKDAIDKNKRAQNWLNLVNSEDANGNTPLTVACQYGNRDAVELLLMAGARANQPDKRGRFPLLIASERGPQSIVDMLEDHLVNREEAVRLRR